MKRMPRTFFRFAMSGGLLILGAMAIAQSIASLEPQSFELTSDNVVIGLVQGQPSQLSAEPWSKNPIRWAFIRSGEVQENRDTVAEWLDREGILRVPLPAAGPIVIGIDFQPQEEEITSNALSRLLEKPKFAKAAVAKIRHFRSAMAIVLKQSPEGTGRGNGVAVTEVSLASSIHPLMDPTTLVPGGDIAFEYTVHGEEVEDAKIYVTNLTTGENFVIRGGESGSCHVTPKPGCSYRLTAQSARENRSDNIFEVYSCSLVFKVPAQKDVRR